MKKTLGLLCLALLFAFASNAGSTTGFLVDCQKLDALINIGSKAAKFDRVSGDYKFDANLVNLEKYGFPISVPIPKDKKLEYVTHADIKIRFVPKDSTSNLSSDNILKIHPYKIKSSARNSLKKILSKSTYDKYKETNIFDFLSGTLGVEKGPFDCDNQDRAVAMFMSSFVNPYDRDGVSVYSFTKLNSLLFVSNDKQFGLIHFIYRNIEDTLLYVSVEGSPKALADYLSLLKKLPKN